jgi:hypothetical protein
MTFLNAYDDFMESIGAFSSPIEKLEYLDSLRDESRIISHWGLEKIHGIQSAQRAYIQASDTICNELLRTPIKTLGEAFTSKSQLEPPDSRVARFKSAALNLPISAPEKTAHISFLNSVFHELASGADIQNSSPKSTHSQFLGT